MRIAPCSAWVKQTPNILIYIGKYWDMRANKDGQEVKIYNEIRENKKRNKWIYRIDGAFKNIKLIYAERRGAGEKKRIQYHIKYKNSEMEMIQRLF